MTSHSTTTKANRPLAPMPPTPPALAPPSQSPNPKETIKAVIIRCPRIAYPIDNNNNNSTTNRFYQSLPIAPLETALHLPDNPPLHPLPRRPPPLDALPRLDRPPQRPAQAAARARNWKHNRETAVLLRRGPRFSILWERAHGPSEAIGCFGRVDGRDLSCQQLGCLVSFAGVVGWEFGRRMEGLEGGGGRG